MSKPRAFDPLPVTLDDEDQRLDERLNAYAKQAGIPEIKKPVANLPTAPDVPLHVTVPEYVLRALKVKAATEGVSVRYLVLKALSSSETINVPEADLVGDRRTRKGGRST